MRTTADHAGDRPEDWEAPGVALVRSAATVAGLRALGGDVIIGHSPRHLDDTDTFVFTTAINPPARGTRRRAGERQAGPAPGRRAGRPPVRRGSRHPQQAAALTPHDTLT